MRIFEAPTLFSTLGYLMLISTAVCLVSPVRKQPPFIRWVVLSVCLGVSLIPIEGLSLVGYPAGLMGSLSITTQILLALTLVRHLLGVDALTEKDQASVLVAVAVGGALLYPLSSGLSRLDLYSLGFDSTGLVLILGALSILAWRLRPRVAAIIPGSVLAFNLELLGSTNLWDYLLDPLLTLYAWGWLLGRALPSARRTVLVR